MSANTQKDINRIIASYERAKKDVENAAKIELEMTSISTTNYKMVWSN